MKRRDFMAAGLGLGLLGLASPESVAQTRGNDVLSLLVKGNRRFMQGRSLHGHETRSWRHSLAHAQHHFLPHSSSKLRSKPMSGNRCNRWQRPSGQRRSKAASLS